VYTEHGNIIQLLNLSPLTKAHKTKQNISNKQGPLYYVGQLCHSGVYHHTPHTHVLEVEEEDIRARTHYEHTRMVLLN
jgi:hypothetical protein